MMHSIADISTPALLLDLDRLEKNCSRMIKRAGSLGVRLRPHIKTAKSADIGRLALQGGSSGITVSTPAEAEYFASAGFGDILYAVGISKGHIHRLATIQRRFGISVTIIADNIRAIADVDEQCDSLGTAFGVFIEIDCGGGRGGVTPDGAALLAVGAEICASRHLRLEGVLTHAGHSYGAESIEAMTQIAEAERLAVVTAAARLRTHGMPVEHVSVGSTPTALCAASLEGVTEMRPGVYTLFDLDQVILGVCTTADIATAVLTTVIGHNPRSRRMLVDAGGLALSKDLSAAKRQPGIGYGLVCPAEGGAPLTGMFVSEVHQEHGFVAADDAINTLFERFPVGTRLRLLPNHACMTAAAYDQYHLVRGEGATCLGRWAKTTGR